MQDQHTTERQHAEQKLASRTAQQERMKIINNAHKAYLKEPDVNKLMRKFPGLSFEDVVLIQTYKPAYSWEPHPFAPYELTNNGSEIRRLTKRVAELTERETATEVADGEDEEIPFDGGIVRYDYRADRVQIEYDQKPDEATITRLKQNGFKWAPSVGVWQRQLTENGKAAAAYLTKTGRFAEKTV